MNLENIITKILPKLPSAYYKSLGQCCLCDNSKESLRNVECSVLVPSRMNKRMAEYVTAVSKIACFKP